jgi:cell division transport system permease protein
MARLLYFARETLISLRRNLLMTIAGIITVMVSLTLFGAILLVSRTVDHGTERWKHGVELEIFMKTDASQQHIDDVRTALEADKAEVKSYRFLDHQAAWEAFKKLFSDQPALIENTTADALPESFRVVPVRAELTKNVKDAFKGMPDVDVVNTAQETVDRLLTITRVIRYVFVGMALVLLTSSLFLIVNTIRLATFARRREIEVMKLVGASNWFVRVPFLAEGLVQGAVGAGFAFGLVYILKILIVNFLHGHQSIFSAFTVYDHDAIVIGIGLFLVGGIIGVLGSAIGLRRFLDA